MTITSTPVGDAIVLRVVGRLDTLTSPEFQKACQQCLDSHCRRMVMDFEGLQFISSAGLRVILMVGKALHAAGGDLGLVGTHDIVKDALRMAGFLTLFPVYETREAALEPR